MRDLRRSLARALSESDEASSALDRVRREGWTLYLVVDRPVDDEDEDEESEAFELTVPPRLTSGDPVFEVDRRDLTFLRSVGIDPRRGRRGDG